jgi:hypothetical protein
MTWQTKEVAKLVAAERLSVLPTERDRERIREALRVRLEQSAAVNEVPLSAEAPPSPGAAGLKWPKALLFGAGATVVAVAIVLALRKPDPAPLVESVPTALAGAVLTSAVLGGTEALPPSRPQPAAALSVGMEIAGDSRPAAMLNHAVPRGTDTLAQEIALIAQAEKDFHAGKLRAALGKIDEYRRRFPRGAMNQERRQLRVQILCGLGRVQEAESEQGRSSAAGQNRVPVCGAGSASGEP